MKTYTITIVVGAPDDLGAEEACRLLNRIIRNGLDVALTTEDTDDPDIGLIEQMTFEDAKPTPRKRPKA